MVIRFIIVIILYKNSKSGYFGLVPDLSGNAFNFSPFEYDVSCGFVIYGLYYVEVDSIYGLPWWLRQ